MTELLTVKEAAKALKISEVDVYKLINDGELKCLKLGRYKVPDFEIDRFIKDNLGRVFDFGRSNKKQE